MSRTYALTIPVAMAIAAVLLMIDGLFSGTLGSPVATSIVDAHQPSSFQG